MIIDICFASDDNYSIHLGTVITSILINSNTDDMFTFHILDGGITEKNKNFISKLKTIKDFNILYYTPDIKKYDEWFEKTMCKGHFSPATFYRISIPSLLNIDKVLYLDCDIIVTDSLRELFEINIDNYYACVVKEEKNKDNYFCAGFLLINNKLWREDNIEDKCIKYYEENYKTCFGDQDVLNAVLKDKVKFLPEKWLYFSHKTYNNYDPNLKDVSIIHYLGHIKPWQVPATDVLLKYEYWKYFKQTPWFSPIEDFNKLLDISIKDRERLIEENKILRNFIEKIIWYIPFSKIRKKIREKLYINN